MPLHLDSGICCPAVEVDSKQIKEEFKLSKLGSFLGIYEYYDGLHEFRFSHEKMLNEKTIYGMIYKKKDEENYLYKNSEEWMVRYNKC